MPNTFDDDIILSVGVDVSHVISQIKQVAEQAQKVYAEVAKTAHTNNINLTRQQKKDVVKILLQQKDESLRIAKAEIEQRLKLVQKELNAQAKARERDNKRLLNALKDMENKWEKWQVRERTAHEKELAAINRKIAERQYTWNTKKLKEATAEELREKKRIENLKQRISERLYAWNTKKLKEATAEELREKKRVEKLKQRIAEREYAYHVRLIKKAKSAELKAQRELEARKAKTFMGAITGGTTFGHKFATTAQYATAGLALWKIEAAMTAVVAESARFDSAMYANMAVLGATSEQAKKLAENSRDIGRQFGGSIEEIDQLALTLGRAGVALKDLNDTVRVGAELATLTGESYNDVAGVLSTFRLAYEDSAISTRSLGDELTYAANASRLSIKDLGTLSNYALTTSRALGLTAEQTLALSTAFSNLGLNASTIGTQIRKLDLLFNSPSKHMQKFWNDFITATGMTKEVARSNITEFIKTLGELSEKDESFVQRSTSGMEQLTAQLIRNLALGKDYFLQHVAALKSGGDDLALQARVMAQSAEHIGERIRNAFITLGDGTFTVLLDDIFDRDRVKRLYDELKTLKRGTVEYKKKAIELKDVLDEMDTKFIDGLEPIIRAVGFIKDGFTGVELVLKTLEHVFYLSALSISKNLDHFITDKLNAIIDGYNTFAKIVGGTKIGFHIKNETTDDLTQKTIELRKEADDLTNSLHDGRDAADEMIKSWKQGAQHGAKAIKDVADGVKEVNKNLNQTLLITPDIKKLFTQTFGEGALSDLKNSPGFDMTSEIQSLVAQAGVGTTENINLEQAKKRVEYAKREYLIAKDRTLAAEKFKALLNEIIRLQKLQAKEAKKKYVLDKRSLQAIAQWKSEYAALTKLTDANIEQSKIKLKIDETNLDIHKLTTDLIGTQSKLYAKFAAVEYKHNKEVLESEQRIYAIRQKQLLVKGQYGTNSAQYKQLEGQLAKEYALRNLKEKKFQAEKAAIWKEEFTNTTLQVLNGDIKGAFKTLFTDVAQYFGAQAGEQLGQAAGAALGVGGEALAGPFGAILGSVAGSVVGSLFGGSSGPSYTERLLAKIDKELEKQTKLLDAQIKLAQAFDRTGTAIIAQFKEAKTEDTAWRDKFGVTNLSGAVMNQLLKNTGRGPGLIRSTLSENASAFGIDIDSSEYSDAYFKLLGKVQAAQEITGEILKTKSNLEILNTLYDNHIISEKKYQTLKDEIITHNKEYVASITEFAKTIASITDELNGILTSLTGNDMVYSRELEDARSAVAKVMNGWEKNTTGEFSLVNTQFDQDAFTEYLTSVVTNLDSLGTSIKALEADLTGDDLEAQASAIKQLEDTTGETFESTQAALDYLQSIELVGNYYIAQNENLAKAKALYADLTGTTEEYNKALALQKLNTGDLVGITWDQIDTDKERADILKKYIDGEIDLTDAQLEAINAINNADYSGSNSLWQGIYDTSIAQRDKLLANVNSDYTYNMFKDTMAAAIGAKNGDAEVFSELVNRAAGYSGALDDSANFSNGFEQRFAQASAANAFDSFAKKAETQLSVLQDVRERLDAIETNTKRTADITETQWREAI